MMTSLPRRIATANAACANGACLGNVSHVTLYDLVLQKGVYVFDRLIFFSGASWIPRSHPEGEVGYTSIVVSSLTANMIETQVKQS